MIDHTGVKVSDPRRSRHFYDHALAPLGYRMSMEVPKEFTGGLTVLGYGVKRPDFWLAEGNPNEPRVHVAFGAGGRRQVDEFYQAALGAGGTDHGPPGPRPHYHASYYGAFVLDPDGHNIEAVCHASAQDRTRPSIKDFKVYTPAKDFEQSKRFYTALGFKMSPGWGKSADFELDGNRFRLQDYYVKDWADNFMVVMSVDDVEAWHQRAREIAQSGGFEGIRIKPPETVDGSIVLHVTDPSGVLLVFVQ